MYDSLPYCRFTSLCNYHLYVDPDLYIILEGNSRLINDHFVFLFFLCPAVAATTAFCIMGFLIWDILYKQNSMTYELLNLAFYPRLAEHLQGLSTLYHISIPFLGLNNIPLY